MLKFTEGVFKKYTNSFPFMFKNNPASFCTYDPTNVRSNYEIFFKFFQTNLGYLALLSFLSYSVCLKNSNSTFSLTILLAASCRVQFIPTYHRKIYAHISVLFLIHFMSGFMSVSLSSQFSTNGRQWHFAATKVYSLQSLLV